MKKFSLILLILVYTSSTFGMVVKEFYCCGKLRSVSLSFSTESKQKAEKKTIGTGCCKTKYFSSKVKDNHVQADAIAFDANHFVQLDTHLSSFKLICFVNPQVNVTSGINDPPLLHSNTPVYIFIRSIRI
ncbi:MAG TPA: hypothetical protein VK705_07330 [Ferruginibacter sp.]|jgi:hypothetical protein|nr:hypothetical protein [Ferruginibacter sp.]